MKKHITITAAALALAGLSACASHDHQDVYLLGGATKANIAQQSIRDVNLPNSKAVETTSGVRAAKAVKALNEGKTKDLKQAQTTTGNN